MKKLILATILVLAGVAVADDGSNGSAATGAVGAGSDVQSLRMRPPPDPKQACFDLLNHDPEFVKAIIDVADKQIDQKTIDAHKDALYHIQKNENHVIYAYAAMWVIAALLVAFLWLRQQALRNEIETLRRDLSKAEAKS
jgi:hypothetical protein